MLLPASIGLLFATAARVVLCYQAGPINENVWDRGLVAAKVDFASVLQAEGSYFDDVNQRNFAGQILAFVTPWNKRGYDVARRFAPKLTHVSPVWYQFRLNSNKQVELKGGHDADDKWISEIVKAGQEGARVPKIVPRVIVEVNPDEVAQFMMGLKDVLDLLIKEAQTHSYDGWTVELWPQWAAAGLLANSLFHTAALKFLGSLYHNLHSVSAVRTRVPLEMHLVIPPIKPAHSGWPATTFEDWHSLSKLSDGVVVMTYDASPAGKPGPNAPIDWMRANLDALLPEEADSQDDAPKLKMGLNFFGKDFVIPDKVTPIIADQYRQILQQHRPLIAWEQKAAEHVIEYVAGGERHVVYFPTLMSIKRRLDLAHEYGAGVAIWELGQGMDFWMDLL